MSEAGSKQIRIKELTSLRGIFILLMFFWHCKNIYPGGGMAVTFFFVLSGFSLTIGYKDRLLQTSFSYKQYFSRRCIKFYPLHWMCLLAAIVLQMSFSFKEVPVFLANASLLQSWIPDRSYYFSYNAVSWYLSDTIFFAAVFPLICRLIVKTSVKWKAGIGALFVILFILTALFAPTKWHHALLYVNPLVRLTDFVLGIFLALFFFYLKENGEKTVFLSNGKVTDFLAIVAIVGLIVEPFLLKGETLLLGPVYWPLVSILLLTVSLSNVKGGGKLLDIKILELLGEHSFAIFMTHQLVIRYTETFFNYFKFESIILLTAISLILTIIASILIDNYILKFLTRRHFRIGGNNKQLR